MGRILDPNPIRRAVQLLGIVCQARQDRQNDQLADLYLAHVEDRLLQCSQALTRAETEAGFLTEMVALLRDALYDAEDRYQRALGVISRIPLEAFEPEPDPWSEAPTLTDGDAIAMEHALQQWANDGGAF